MPLVSPAANSSTSDSASSPFASEPRFARTPDTEVRIDTVDDAIAVVAMGGLYCRWFPAGCGDAFAHWLYLNRQHANPAHLEEEVSEYIDAWFDQRSHGGDLDAESYAGVRMENRFRGATEKCWAEMARLIEHTRKSHAGRLALGAFEDLALSRGQETGSRPQTILSLEVLSRLLSDLHAISQQLSFYMLLKADQAYEECQLAGADAFMKAEHILRITEASALDEPPTVISLIVGLARDGDARRKVANELLAAKMKQKVAKTLSESIDAPASTAPCRRRMGV